MPSLFRNPFAPRIALVLALDVACLLAAAFAAHAWVGPPLSLATFAAVTAAIAIGALLVLQVTGAYDLATIRSPHRTRIALLSSMGIGFAGSLVVYVALPLSPGGADLLLHAATLFFPLFLLERTAFRSVAKRVRKRIVLVGASDLAFALARQVESRSDLGLEIAGMLCSDADEVGTHRGGIPVFGHLHSLEKVIGEGRADWVVVTSQERGESLPADQLLSLKVRGVRISSGLALYERITGEVFHQALRPSVLIFDERFGMNAFERASKRALDVAIASLALVLSAPVLLVAAIAIRVDSKGPVLFRQTRVGRFHKPFRVVKLRTMEEGAENDTGPVFASREDLRITRVGRILRRARIDELPQFWNVLKGEMSVVGPRPERPEFLDEISVRFPYFGVRSACKPGVTGWAQVRFGYVSDIDGFEQKLAFDLYYVRNWSLAMDLAILWRTVRTIFSFSGV